MDEQFLAFLCAEPRNLRRQKYECIAEPLCIYVIGIVHLAIMLIFLQKVYISHFYQYSVYLQHVLLVINKQVMEDRVAAIFNRRGGGQHNFDVRRQHCGKPGHPIGFISRI